MNFLQYHDAYEMMQQTGLSAEECLRLVNIELENIRKNLGEKYEEKAKQKIEGKGYQQTPPK